MTEQLKKDPPEAPARTVGISRQDVFSQTELTDLLGNFDLKRGKYELDVGEKGDIKISRIKKEWIQKEELIGG